MTDQEVKSIFRACLPNQRKLKALQSYLSDLRADAYGLKAIVNDGMPHGAAVGDPVYSAYISVEKTVTDICQSIGKCADKIKQAYDLLDLASDGDGKTVIIDRWFLGMPFEEIADELHISRPTMFRKYDIEITRIVKKSGQNYKDDTE